MDAGIVIRYYCDPDSLADVPFNEFEARVYDAFRREWPGATVNVVMGHGHTWGQLNDGIEIPADEIRRVANDTFAAICAGD